MFLLRPAQPHVAQIATLPVAGESTNSPAPVLRDVCRTTCQPRPLPLFSPRGSLLTREAARRHNPCFSLLKTLQAAASGPRRSRTPASF